VQIKDKAAKMLCCEVDSLDALNKLKEAKACACKEESNRKALETLVPDPYDFL
jgi:hypothetical protein